MVLWLAGAARAEVVINEFMADNATTLTDQQRAYSDWIELHNSGPEAVNLEGWSLTDTETNRAQWRFPAQNLSAGAYLVVFASGKHVTTPGAQLHTNFKLASGGGYLALVRPDGGLAMELRYPAQLTDVSAGRTAGGDVEFFEQPTPAAPNTAAWPTRAGGVEFSPPGGLITEATPVTLTTDTPGAEIRYTLDGTVPNLLSPRYTGPITVSATTRVRARAFAPGTVPGPLGGAGYTLVSTALRTFSSNLPLLVVDTFGRAILEGSRVACHLTVVSTNGGRATLGSRGDFQSVAGIEIRGSSSTGFPKKSYGLELAAESGADQDAPLLGLPAESDWVLYAPYTDKTLIRDVLAYELSNRIGRYAPRTRLVELYWNQSGPLEGADYQGVYVLVEKLKGGADRVDITKVEATDYAEPEITGGFIMKKDRLDSTDAPFNTLRGQQLGFEWPKPRELGAVQLAWMRSFMNRFESALYGAGYRSPLTGYPAYIDPDTFVDHRWLVEVAKNIDGYRLSTFMHKDRGGRLNMGPIWDYNLSFGNADYNGGWQTTGWYSDWVGGNEYPWYPRLFQDSDFAQRFNDRWPSLRTNALTTTNLIALINGYTNLLAEAQVRNFNKWRILGTYVWPNYFVGRTYADEIGFLKQWVTGRLEWLDTTVLPWPQFSQPAGYYPEGVTVALQSPHTIYYTLDGRDPRAPGGNVAAGALRYLTPINITTNTRVFARARNASTWSPPVAAGYSVTPPPLRITELMYHPPTGLGSDRFDDEEFEFIELRNTGTEALPLAGFVLGGGVEWTFPNVETLLPGESAVLVENEEAFRLRYGDQARVVGKYSGKLSNAGERLTLTGPLGEPLLDFTYSDQWQPATDGAGPSLTIRDAQAAADTWKLAASWKSSAITGGTPGRHDGPLFTPALSLMSLTGPLPGGSVRIRLQAGGGQTFTLQATDRAAGSTWQNLTNLPPPADGAVLELELPATGDAVRFFRVVTPRVE